MNEQPLPSEKPFLFTMIGWSWLVMGVLGLLSGLIGLAGMPALKQTEDLIMANYSELLPMDKVRDVLDWYLPMIAFQIASSALMAWAGWEFLKRKNWARLALSFLNALMGLGVIYSLARARQMASAFMSTLPEEFVGNAAAVVPLLFWITGLLLVLPVIWMAWYFHQRKTTDYFLN